MIREDQIVTHLNAANKSNRIFSGICEHMRVVEYGKDAEEIRQAQEAYLKLLYGNRLRVTVVMVPVLIPFVEER
jgi:hypothetical protein